MAETWRHKNIPETYSPLQTRRKHGGIQIYLKNIRLCKHDGNMEAYKYTLKIFAFANMAETWRDINIPKKYSPLQIWQKHGGTQIYLTNIHL